MNYTLYKYLHGIRLLIWTFICTHITRFRLLSSGVKIGKKLAVCGYLNLHIEPGSTVTIGKNVRINSGFLKNSVGGSLRTGIWVCRNAELLISDGAGISNSTIACWESVKIGSDTFIGGDVHIYDTDFHPLTIKDRANHEKAGTAPVEIGSNVFIGGHCTILKGVKIGDGAVIGAGSIVTKDIPANEVWAGNPAKFIRKIDQEI